MNKLLLILAALALAVTAAFAQTYPPAYWPTIGVTADAVPVIQGGVGTTPAKYATPAQISGVWQYTNLGVATTGNTYAFAHNQVNMIMQPSGTLAAVTLTTDSNPSDGQRECFLSTQTTTSLTWNAASGQTMNNAPTAGVAMTPICMQYVLANATWYRAP
jgi:hypothetical protein